MAGVGKIDECDETNNEWRFENLCGRRRHSYSPPHSIKTSNSLHPPIQGQKKNATQIVFLRWAGIGIWQGTHVQVGSAQLIRQKSDSQNSP